MTDPLAARDVVTRAETWTTQTAQPLKTDSKLPEATSEPWMPQIEDIGEIEEEEETQSELQERQTPESPCYFDLVIIPKHQRDVVNIDVILFQFGVRAGQTLRVEVKGIIDVNVENSPEKDLVAIIAAPRIRRQVKDRLVDRLTVSSVFLVGDADITILSNQKDSSTRP